MATRWQTSLVMLPSTQIKHLQNFHDWQQNWLKNHTVLLSKFGGSSLNAWWFMAWTSSGLTDIHTHTDTHRQTDTGNDYTRRPKLVSGKNNVNSTIRLTTLIILIFSNFGPIWQGNAILLVWWTRSSILYQCLVMQPGLLVSGSIVQRIYLGKVKSYWLHFSSSKLYKTKFDTWA